MYTARICNCKYLIVHMCVYLCIEYHLDVVRSRMRGGERHTTTNYIILKHSSTLYNTLQYSITLCSEFMYERGPGKRR